MEDPRGKRVLEPLFDLFTVPLRATIAAHKAEVGSSGTETVDLFMLELPLRDVFYFQGVKLPVPPEDMLDRLLAQVHGQAK
jgi:hypothetical protein